EAEVAILATVAVVDVLAHAAREDHLVHVAAALQGPGDTQAAPEIGRRLAADVLEEKVDQGRGKALLLGFGEGAADLRVDSDGLGNLTAYGLDAVQLTGPGVPGHEPSADFDGPGLDDGAVPADRDLAGAAPTVEVHHRLAFARA